VKFITLLTNVGGGLLLPPKGGAPNVETCVTIVEFTLHLSNSVHGHHLRWTYPKHWHSLAKSYIEPTNSFIHMTSKSLLGIQRRDYTSSKGEGIWTINNNVIQSPKELFWIRMFVCFGITYSTLVHKLFSLYAHVSIGVQNFENSPRPVKIKLRYSQNDHLQFIIYSYVI